MNALLQSISQSSQELLKITLNCPYGAVVIDDTSIQSKVHSKTAEELLQWRSHEEWLQNEIIKYRLPKTNFQIMRTYYLCRKN
jgi:hypothetical protein